MDIKTFLKSSETSYSACDNVKDILLKDGFTELYENTVWNIVKGGKYFTIKGGSALIAFKTGENCAFNIVASHADSPCFKLKANPTIKTENYVKYNVEKYGGGILYSWLDRPLKVAGKVVIDYGNKLVSKTFSSCNTVVIPSLAIHYNKTVNDGVKFNPQVDTLPIAGLDGELNLEKELKDFADGNKILDADLFLIAKEEPFNSGYNGELLSAPRIDNLTSVFSSVTGLIDSKPKSVAVAFIADNEEIGSETLQGAGSTFLRDTLKRIADCYKTDLSVALADSFMVSCDNAHAVHPNHAELSDLTNKVLMGEGVVIKHHANKNYTSDGLSGAVFKKILDKAGVKYQDFYMRSDLPCGGTLGKISSTQVSINSVDIGIGQLAMHSAVETMAINDFYSIQKGITAFYGTKIKSPSSTEIVID